MRKRKKREPAVGNPAAGHIKVNDMKILVVCQHYWPEPYPLADVCEEMVKRGHSVHILTDVPNYPMGYIYPEYKGGKRRNETRNGVRITRTFTIGRRNNILFRFLNYYSYAISSTLYAKRLKEEYDVVLTNQTSPVMMSYAALAYAKKWKKKCLLYCMDLWPASLAAGGVKETSPLYRFFNWVSSRVYRNVDRILITSEMFRDYFKEKFGIADENIGYLPQYANAAFDAVLPPGEPSENVNLVFAGNVGAAQSLNTVLEAAKLLENEQHLRWHIIGDGSELENLKNMAKKLCLNNVIFHGRKPQEQMPQYYAMADAMLVTLTADPFISLTLPAKVQSYMAAGKPILAASDGEIPKVLAASGCGFCAGAEDAVGLAKAVRAFLITPDKKRLGTNARKYYEENFSREMFMSKLESELKRFCTE